MIVKTTIEIYNEIDELKRTDEFLFTRYKNHNTFINEWVCLSGLKKEITEIRYALNQGKLQKAKVLINNLDSELYLCKSSEQNESSYVSTTKNDSTRSVSGEHNTGEDVKVLSDMENTIVENKSLTKDGSSHLS